MRTWILGALALLTVQATVMAQMPRKGTELDLPEPFKSAKPQERLAALRVAEVDAKRRLIERIYGSRVTGNTLVYDFLIERDDVRNKVDTFLRGATQVGRPKYTAQGIVHVVYGVKLRKVMEIIKATIKKKDGELVEQRVLEDITVEDKLIEAWGNGALKGTKGLEYIRAKRAAEIDAFRKMAERLAGVKLTSTTTVRNMMLEDDTIQTAFSAYLKGLKPIDVVFNDDGTVEVKMQLKVRETIETITKIVTRKKKLFSTSVEEVLKLNTQINDTYFTVTGTGAPRDSSVVSGAGVSGGGSTDVYTEEKVILKRVLSKEIVIE